ncbi:hypothetical protein K474DRAFT_1679479 [Panus rudis PR-1116 ss-1]|nr:hypothetical protein K474DRAFT_1679479 [Panus rudis PR-1116 ss-1]
MTAGQQPTHLDNSMLQAIEDDTNNSAPNPLPYLEEPQEHLEDAPPYEAAFEDFQGNLGTVQAIVETIEYHQVEMSREVRATVGFVAMAMTQRVELAMFLSDLVVDLGVEVPLEEKLGRYEVLKLLTGTQSTPIPTRERGYLQGLRSVGTTPSSGVRANLSFHMRSKGC